MRKAAVYHPDWWEAAEQIGYEISSITIFDDQVIVSARRADASTARRPHYTTVDVARTDDERTMIRAMQARLRLEGGPE
jgi:hypothetical protein